MDVDADVDARSGAEEDSTPPSLLTRRAVLGGTASAIAVGAAGARATAGTAAAQQSGMAEVPDYGGWFTDAADGGATSSFDGTVDERGTDAVTIEVGASGNGGPFAFAPTAVWVDPGTTVTFQWTSDTHNVVVEDQPGDAGWKGHQTVEDAGFSFEHAFETGGIYTFYCEPHLGLGMKGAIVVGDDVPTTAPRSAGGGFAVPGGDDGAAFMGVLFGTAGLAAAIVLAGEVHGSVTVDADGPTSAHTTALAAVCVGLFLLVAVVVRLVLA